MPSPILAGYTPRIVHMPRFSSGGRLRAGSGAFRSNRSTVPALGARLRRERDVASGHEGAYAQLEIDMRVRTGLKLGPPDNGKWRAAPGMTERPPKGAMASGLADPGYVESIRGDMLRFARMQLGNDSEAEDVVQEALTAAIRDAEKFRSEAALKTWVIAILKHKIADILRQRQGRPLLASELTEGDDPIVRVLFDQRGMWRDAARPASWENPESGIHDRQLLAVFDACLNKLPAQQGRVFLMREVVGLDTAEICREIDISPTNLRVILHRARLALRSCLEQNGMQP